MENIVRKMEQLLQKFQESNEPPGLVPFLDTYLGVTKRVNETSQKETDYFKNIPALHALDLDFADRYFKPIQTFVSIGQRQTPWQTYLDYCGREDSLPFVQMLLGVNAHINGDLCQTLVSADYQERADFLAINDLLKIELRRVLSFLAFSEHDLIGFGGLIFQGYTEDLFYQLVVRWREDAWNHAQRIRAGDIVPSVIDASTEKLAIEIIRLFDELTRLQDVKQNLRLLGKLTVRDFI